MPASSILAAGTERQLLIQLGERLRRLRLDQGLTASAVAEGAGISRMTLSAVEAGEPSPTIGTYLKVMSVLGVAGDFALLASGELRRDAPAGSSAVTLRAPTAPHGVQDLQSLLLHEEAVRRLREQPDLVNRALDTLDKWRASGDTHSRVLWDEWSVILRRKDWRRVLTRTRRAQELRQASPITVLLPPHVREHILSDVRKLKAGVSLGHVPAGSLARRTAAGRRK